MNGWQWRHSPPPSSCREGDYVRQSRVVAILEPIGTAWITLCSCHSCDFYFGKSWDRLDAVRPEGSDYDLNSIKFCFTMLTRDFCGSGWMGEEDGRWNGKLRSVDNLSARVFVLRQLPHRSEPSPPGMFPYLQISYLIVRVLLLSHSIPPFGKLIGPRICALLANISTSASTTQHG